MPADQALGKEITTFVKALLPITEADDFCHLDTFTILCVLGKGTMIRCYMAAFPYWDVLESNT